MKTLRRAVLYALFAGVALGVLAPFLKANRLRPYIQAALEAGLNRPVAILGDVRLNLFTGPGFSVERVTIGDDPAAGIEPFAYVESMRARVRLTSLLAGKLAFSSIHLDAPRVNVVKMQNGPWNIQPLLDRPSAAKPIHSHTVPDIQISGGRLNFKFGDTKSVFFIKDADVDVYPNQSGQLVIRFTGLPARSDRGAQTFGEISARGLLHFDTSGADQLTMGLHLERTSILELVHLFNARDMGVHGFTTAEGNLSGPLDKLVLTGSFNLNDIHRWDLMPTHGDGWTMHYRGLLNLRAHQLDVETFSDPGQTASVSIQLHLDNYLASAQWRAGISFHALPAASLVETARHMGAPLPDGVQMDGHINGEIAYSNQAGLDGHLAIDQASLKYPRAGSAKFDSASVSLTNNEFILDPVSVRSDNDQSAEIEGRYAYDGSHSTFKVTTSQFTNALVETGAQQLVDSSPIPLLATLRQGAWKGWIAFDKKEDHPGIWTGEYELQNAVLEIQGLASPVRFTSASVEMKQDQLQINRIHARSGAVRIEGDYRYDAAAASPNRLRLRIPELTLAELERLMMPTLRRNQGFLARFRRTAPLPKWLEDRELDATIQIANLLNGDEPLGEFRTQLVWDGPEIGLSDIDCRLDPMHATGNMTVSLAKDVPHYTLTGQIENLAYKSGQIDIDGQLETSGTGSSLLPGVSSDGTFEGRQIMLGPETLVREIAGSYHVAPVAGIPRLLLSNLQVLEGSDTLTGQGSSQADGRIILELSSGRRQVRLTGMLLPIHPEPVAGR